MNRVLSSGLAVVAGVVVPATVSPNQTRSTPAPQYRRDPRLQTLREFFGKAECPALAYSQVFLDAADRYALDWRLLPSISFIESTGGKATRNNNLFGWDSGRAQFDSPAAAIHAVGYRLAHSNLYKNKDLNDLLATYNRSVEYAQKVKSVMRRIALAE